MSMIFILIPLSIVIAAGFLFAFVWAVKSGQYEDVCTPSLRVLLEETSGRSMPRTVDTAKETSGCVGQDRSSASQCVQDPFTPIPASRRAAKEPLL